MGQGQLIISRHLSEKLTDQQQCLGTVTRNLARCYHPILFSSGKNLLYCGVDHEFDGGLAK